MKHARGKMRGRDGRRRNGGKRNGAGRKPVNTGDFLFRDFCRKIICDPDVQQVLKERALVDPEFALKIAEHGFGRPPQSLEVKGKLGGSGAPQVFFDVVFADGAPLPAAGNAEAPADAAIPASAPGGQAP